AALRPSLATLGEERTQGLIGRLGRLFGQEVTAGDGLAADILGVLAPHAEHVEPAALRTALAPQHEQRHRELAAALGAVVFEVDRGPARYSSQVARIVSG